MISGDIYKELVSLQDKGYRDMQITTIPSLDPDSIIGVRTPALRSLAKELSKREDIDKFLNSLPHKYFEENQLHAFLIEQERDFTAAVSAVDAFLPFVDNWSTCDQRSAAAFKGHFAELLPHVRRWMADPAPYTCRFGLGMLMRYGLDGDFDPVFLEEAADPAITGREHYYVRMMVAWFFATALAKRYDETLPYIVEGRLPLWTHNKAIQKACESFRVTEEHKGELRAMRRKR